TTLDQLEKRKEADLIVFPFWERHKKGQKQPKAAALLNAFQALIKPALESGDFEGSAGETLMVYTKGQMEKRCLLLGLGKEEEITIESVRKAYSNVTKECQKKAVTTLNLVVPTITELRKVSVEECLKGIAEGVLLTNYKWEKLVSVDEETVLLKS